jgi:hypothetical protein
MSRTSVRQVLEQARHWSLRRSPAAIVDRHVRAKTGDLDGEGRGAAPPFLAFSPQTPIRSRRDRAPESAGCAQLRQRERRASLLRSWPVGSEIESGMLLLVTSAVEVSDSCRSHVVTDCRPRPQTVPSFSNGTAPARWLIAARDIVHTRTHARPSPRLIVRIRDSEDRGSRAGRRAAPTNPTDQFAQSTMSVTRPPAGRGLNEAVPRANLWSLDTTERLPDHDFRGARTRLAPKGPCATAW